MDSHRQQVGDVKKSDLPGPEALSQPGKKEGQVIMVRSVGGSVEAHQVRQTIGDRNRVFTLDRLIFSGAHNHLLGKKSAKSWMLWVPGSTLR